jgi:hypothetical protein
VYSNSLSCCFASWIILVSGRPLGSNQTGKKRILFDADELSGSVELGAAPFLLALCRCVVTALIYFLLCTSI